MKTAPITPAPGPNLGTINEAAERYHQSRDTIRRRIADGTITGFRSGPRTILVDLDEADAKLLRPIVTVDHTAGAQPLRQAHCFGAR